MSVRFVNEDTEREFQEFSRRVNNCCPDAICDAHSAEADALADAHLNDIVEICNGLDITQKRYSEYVFEAVRI